MDSTIDLQFVEYIVKSLVGNPAAVSIARTIDEKGVLLELTVDPEDLGRVIGKRGATAQSLRTLLRALGTKNDARYNLKIVDNGEPRPPREDRDGRQQGDDRPERSERRQEDDRRPARSESTEHPQHTEQSSEGSAPEPAQREDAQKASASEDAWGSPSSTAVMSTSDDDHSDAISKTRKDLADLDDLDI